MKSLGLRPFFLILILSLTRLNGVWAAPAGNVRGVVLDPSGAVVPQANVALSNHITGYTVQAPTDSEGKFNFFNVPENPYELTVSKAGFKPFVETLHLHGPRLVDLTLRLELAGSETSVQVTAEPTMVEEHSTGSSYDINRGTIQRLPTPVLSRGMENVLLSTPGFIADENGRFHFRGSHGQVAYVVDGMPITDQLHVTFSNSLDPRNVESLEVITGNIPAEFGEKSAAVLNITTRSGLGAGRRARGNVMLGGGSFGTGELASEVGGGNERFGYFLSAASSTSGRFLDPVNFENFHNHGNTQRLFARFDFSPNGTKDFFHLNVTSGRTAHQVVNLLSQEMAGQDQRARLGDFSVSLSWLRIIGTHGALTLSPYFRTSLSQLYPSPFDTPVTAQQDRHLTTVGGRVDFALESKGQRLKTGAHILGVPLREAFAFGITSPEFNDPASEEFNPNLAGYDLTRGGMLFRFRDRRYGQVYAAYLQDSLSWRHLTVNAGVRYTRYQLLVREGAWQPRLGLAYLIPRTQTVLRASYDHLFFLPDHENILLSASPRAAGLVAPDVRLALGTAYQDVASERQNSYEVGLQQGFSHYLRLDAAYYTKDSRNIHDSSQFLNTGILFPVAVTSGKIRGFDFRADFPEHHGWSGYLSLGSARAVVTPPFSGGLFLGHEAVDVLAEGPFHIDHDQKLSAQWSVQYRSPKRWYTIVTGRYDSGLVTEIEDVDAVAADPDLAFGLRYVNLNADPLRVKPRTVWNWLIGTEVFPERRYRTEAQFGILNLANERGLYNFLSVFGGTHVIPPRTFTARLTFHF